MAGLIHAPSDQDASRPTTGANIRSRNAPSGDVDGDTVDVVTSHQFAVLVNEHIRHFISAADQKAIFFCTGATALLAFLYDHKLSARWMKPLAAWLPSDVFALTGAATLAVGAFLSLLVVIPRSSGSGNRYFNWDAITTHNNTGEEYGRRVIALSRERAVRAQAEYCFDMARVCTRKYRMLRRALWVGATGMAGALLTFLLL